MKIPRFLVENLKHKSEPELTIRLSSRWIKW